MELVLCKQNTDKSQSYGGSEMNNVAEEVNLPRSELSEKWREKQQRDDTLREIERLREIPGDFPYFIGLWITSYMWVLCFFLAYFQ